MQDIFARWSRIGVVFTEACIQEHTRDSSITLYSCPACGFGVFHPAVVGSTRFYEELQSSPVFTYYPSDKWEFRQALAEIEPGNRVLEIGCGDGVFLAMTRERGAKPAGIEYNDVSVSKAREKGEEVTRKPLAEVADESPAAFDVVCAFQVLEHVADPLDFLADMSRCTRSGGKVLIAVPNNAVLGYVYDSLLEIPPHHVTRWTASSLSQAGTRAGLKVARVTNEPLSHEHFSLFVYYWYHIFGGRNLPSLRLVHLLRSVGGVIIMRGMDILSRLGVKSLPMFRGHSLYVVFVKI